jgi:hypothetical protein
VCQRGNKSPLLEFVYLLSLFSLSSAQIYQRFFQVGFRFSTKARKPSCESSNRYNSFRKIFMEFFNPSFSDIPIPLRIAFFAIVNTGPEWLPIR